MNESNTSDTDVEHVSGLGGDVFRRSAATFEFGFPATDQTDEAAGDEADHFGHGLHLLLQDLSAQSGHFVLLRPAALCLLLCGGVPSDGVGGVRSGDVVFPHHMVDAQIFLLVPPAADQAAVSVAVQHQNTVTSFSICRICCLSLGAAIFIIPLPILLLTITGPLSLNTLLPLLTCLLYFSSITPIIPSSPLRLIHAVCGDDVLVQLVEVPTGVEAAGAVEQPGGALVHKDVAEATYPNAVQAGGVRGRHVGQLVGVALGEVATMGTLEVSCDTSTCLTTSLYDNRHRCSHRPDGENTEMLGLCHNNRYDCIKHIK